MRTKNRRSSAKMAHPKTPGGKRKQGRRGTFGHDLTKTRKEKGFDEPAKPVELIIYRSPRRRRAAGK